MTDALYSRTTDADGIVTIVLDDPDSSVNTMNEHFEAALTETVDWLEANVDDITGVIITSAKKTFFAGGDLDKLRRADPNNSEAETAQVEASRLCCVAWRSSASPSSPR